MGFVQVPMSVQVLMWGMGRRRERMFFRDRVLGTVLGWAWDTGLERKSFRVKVLGMGT